nr:uncharacterized protein LOC106691079 [Halyomorpha halys]
MKEKCSADFATACINSKDNRFLDLEEKTSADLTPVGIMSENTGFFNANEKPSVGDEKSVESYIDKDDNPLKEFADFYFKLLSEDIVYQNLLKKIGDRKNNEGIFTGYSLENYLKNHSKLNVCFDLNELYGKLSKLLKCNLPLTLPWISTNDNHKHCIEVLKILLGMIINIDIGKSLPEEVAKNVEKLREKINIIDSMWAHIAAYAVHSNISDKNVKRCLIPLILDSLTKSVKLGNFPIKTSKVNELVVQSVDQNNCDFGASRMNRNENSVTKQSNEFPCFQEIKSDNSDLESIDESKPENSYEAPHTMKQEGRSLETDETYVTKTSNINECPTFQEIKSDDSDLEIIDDFKPENNNITSQARKQEGRSLETDKTYVTKTTNKNEFLGFQEIKSADFDLEIIDKFKPENTNVSPNAMNSEERFLETYVTKTSNINEFPTFQEINSDNSNLEIIDDFKPENNNITSHARKQEGRSLEIDNTCVTKKSYITKSRCLQALKTSNCPCSGRIDEFQLAKYLVCYPTDSSAKVRVKVNEPLYKYGLLCLTEGFGFLFIRKYSPDKLLVQDPLRSDIFRARKDLDDTNEWLNRLIKSCLFFESADINLKWVIVKRALLQYFQPLGKLISEQPSKYAVNKDGILVDMVQISSKQEMKESMILKHHQLSGQILRAFGKIIENNFNTEVVPSKKLKRSSSSSSCLLNANEKSLVHQDQRERGRGE